MSNVKLSTSQNSSLAGNQSISNNGFWLSFIPIFGGLSIVNESRRIGNRTGIQLGWVVFSLAIVTALAESFAFVWLLQIGLAVWLKAQHTQPPVPALPQVDFNSCSKHELVRVLNIPIVYANDIDLIRNEGHLFTHAEELVEIAGLPEAMVQRLIPQLIFSYDAQKDDDHTWRQVNCLTAKEMVVRGVNEVVAQKIVEERALRGDYRSAIDVKKRTGLAFRAYQQLV